MPHHYEADQNVSLSSAVPEYVRGLLIPTTDRMVELLLWCQMKCAKRNWINQASINFPIIFAASVFLGSAAGEEAQVFRMGTDSSIDSIMILKVRFEVELLRDGSG